MEKTINWNLFILKTISIYTFSRQSSSARLYNLNAQNRKRYTMDKTR